MTSSWQTKSSKVMYENPWMTVREDQVIRPNGKEGMYGVISSKSDAVFVVPVDAEGSTYIIKQEHYTTRQLDWQCIAGRTDREAAEVAAKRELLEEAGLRAKSITILSSAKTAAGMTTFKSTICLARELQFDNSLIDEEEGITEIKKISLDIAKEMILSGEIANTESIAALLLAMTYIEQERKV